MIIREARPEDSSAICRISSRELGYPCTEALVKRQMEAVDQKREAVFVAEINGGVCGFIHAERYCTLYMEPMVNILGLAVSQEYQRQGAGRALLAQAERWGKNLGLRGVRLNSGMKRTEAHKFYRAMGYGSEKAQLRFLKDF